MAYEIDKSSSPEDLIAALHNEGHIENFERGVILASLKEDRIGRQLAATICRTNPETGAVYKDYSNPYRNVIALCIKECRKMSEETPVTLNRSMFDLLLPNLQTQYPDLVSVSEKDQLLEEWDNLKEGRDFYKLARQAPVTLAWAKRQRLKKRISNAQFKLDEGGAFNVDMMLQSVNQDISLAEVTDEDDSDEPLSWDEIVNASSNKKKTVFMSSGQALMDKFLGGGFAKGYSYLFTTGSGGGKTAMFICVAANMSIKQNHKCLWISTEEPEQEVVYRLISNYCNVQLQSIRDQCQTNGLADLKLPPNIKGRFNSMVNKFKENILIRQWKTTNYNLKADLNAEIRKFEKKMGCPPDYVIFDWLMPSDGALSGDNTLRNDLKSRAFAMDSISKTTGITTLYAMQAGQQYSKKMYISPDCVDECKNAHQKAAGVIGWSFMPNTDDAEGACSDTLKPSQTMFIGKTRFSAGGACPIERKLAVAQFHFK